MTQSNIYPSIHACYLADVWSWFTIQDRPSQELLTAAVVVLAGVIAFIPLRTLIRRARLTPAYAVLIVSLATYIAFAVIEPGRIRNGADPMTWWLNRVFVACLLFVGVRLFDRLMIVPLLSRGGTVAVPRFIRQIMLIVVWIFVILMYGKQAFGWPISDFLTGGAVVSIVIGLALQESLGNLFSGLFMQAAPPFVPGDFISVGDIEGCVVDMTWRAVTIRTNYDNFIVIPNGSIAKEQIQNYHAPDTVTAKLVKIGLEYDLPPADAVAVLLRAALETHGVLQTPTPTPLVLDFADSSVTYGIKFWISEPMRHQKIEHELRMNLWYRLKEKGYAIPFPVRVVEHIGVPAKLKQARTEASAERSTALENVSLLAPLSVEQRRQLAETAVTARLAAGQVLFQQDEPGESFYIIDRGKVEVSVKTAGGHDSVVATLGPGDFFGEMSALTGQPRSATVRAAAALTLVEIRKQHLQAIVDADASILEKISGIIAVRNAEREAHVKGTHGAGSNDDGVKAQQRSLLGRMAAFFGIPAN